MQKKILLVDDDRGARQGLVAILQFEGFSSSQLPEATNCKEMMKALDTNSITHLVLDILLPDGSGVEMLGAIRILYPTLPIMIVSQQSKIPISRVLEKYGIFYYWNKMSDQAEGVSQLRKFINSDHAINKSFCDTGSASPVTKYHALLVEELIHYAKEIKNVPKNSDQMKLKERVKIFRIEDVSTPELDFHATATIR